MAGNFNLRRADGAKNDEFYTQLVDIENELRHYKEFFKGKVVFCNCDDPFESNFFKYFAMNFNHLGLKKLICTCYDDSPIAYEQVSLFEDMKHVRYDLSGRHAYKIEITEVDDYNNDGAVDLSDVKYLLKNKNNAFSLLKGNGDFRSVECVELLEECDVVVTNPPFSLFREYIAQLIKYNKKFLIIGNMNAITYKEFFPLIKDNKLWAGYTFNKTLEFNVPCTYKGEFRNGKKYGRVPAVNWYTNIEIDKRKEKLILYKTYTPENYPKFDNYDAINVDKVTDIPCDYYSLMGVPITFIDKHNPEQFEIIDGIGRYSILDNERTKAEGKYLSMINGVAKYFRILIRRKTNEN